MKKYLTLGLCFVLGGLLAASILFHQIRNRYEMGYNTGYVQGGMDIVRFLDENISNDNRAATTFGIFHDHKDARISIVEINGVKTVVVE